MHDALGKSHHLDIEYLLARCLHVGRGRNEGMRVDSALQHKLTVVLGWRCLDVANAKLMVEYRILNVALCIDIGRIGTALRAESLHVYLCCNHL